MKKTIFISAILVSVFIFSCKNKETNQKTTQLTNDTINKDTISTVVQTPSDKTIFDILASIPEKTITSKFTIDDFKKISEDITDTISSKEFYEYFDKDFLDNKSNFKALFKIKTSNNTNLLFFSAKEFLFDEWIPTNFWVLIINKDGKIEDCSYALCFYDEIDEAIPDTVKIIETDNNKLFLITLYQKDINLCFDTSGLNISHKELIENFYYYDSLEIANNKFVENDEITSYEPPHGTKIFSGTIGNEKVAVELDYYENDYGFTGTINFVDDSTKKYTLKSGVPPDMCFTDVADIFSKDKKIGNIELAILGDVIYGQAFVEGEKLPVKLKKQ